MPTDREPSDDEPTAGTRPDRGAGRRASGGRVASGERKGILLRLDPAVHDALARWAAAELRSTNAQIEFLLRQSLRAGGRLPTDAGAMRRPGRPRVRSADTGPGPDLAAEPGPDVAAEPDSELVAAPDSPAHREDNR